MSVPDLAGVFERHHLAVFRFLRRMTGSASAAEDLTQEVFLRVIRGAERYEERAREVSWVFRIARNVLVDRHRAQARAPERVAIQDGGPYPIPAMQPLGIALDEAVARLPQEDREAFLLREVGGLGYAEISEATGATHDAVRMRIYRARLALRAALGHAHRAAERA
jgi:RNA polymerase sigma-70 factor (ECF subfamily)